MILLDTNICIYVMRGHPPAVYARFDAQTEPLGVSIVTVAELEYGVHNSSQRLKNARALDKFLDQLQIVPWDRACAKQYAKIRSQTKSQPIGSEDVMIAATALALDALLVTNNGREFTRIDGLRWENWVDPSAMH